MTKLTTILATGALMASSLSASAAVLGSGSNDWEGTITNAPAFCTIPVPTIDAKFIYNATSARLDVATADMGRVDFDMNSVTSITFVTDGILKINGTPHATPVPGGNIGFVPWQSLKLDNDATTINGTYTAATRTALWTLPAGNTHKSGYIKTGTTVVPPTDIVFRNGDVITLTWQVTCEG